MNIRDKTRAMNLTFSRLPMMFGMAAIYEWRCPGCGKEKNAASESVDTYCQHEIRQLVDERAAFCEGCRGSGSKGWGQYEHPVEQLNLLDSQVEM